MKRHSSLIPLSHEHQHGLALAVLIERRSLPDGELAAKVAAMWESELKKHFRVEEEILFPAALGRIEDAGVIEELKSQHGELRRLVESVKLAEVGALRGRLEAFGGLLSRHIRTEERVLFEQAQAALGEDEMEALGAALREQGGQVCPGP